MNEKSARRFSFICMLLTLVTVAWYDLATPLFTVLFSYLALFQLRLFCRTWIAIVFFLVLVFAVFFGFVLFIRQAATELPRIVEVSFPLIVDYAKQSELIKEAMEYSTDNPFRDIDSLRELTARWLRSQLTKLGQFAHIATEEFVFLIVGLVIAASMFVTAKLDLGEGTYAIKDNFYSVLCREVSARFVTFFRSFRTVMGAQIIISLINTVFTGIFLFVMDFPYSGLLLVITFLCGLLPIIGNLISNTIIFCVGVTQSLKTALIALLYLIVIHKFEYFLNSRIVGGRIKNPMWLTLIGFIVGERIMGIPGMLLAPIVLHYIKVETSQIEVLRNNLSSKDCGTVGTTI